MKRRPKRHRKRHFVRTFFVFILVCAAIGWFLYSRIEPSNKRTWSPDQTILPYADIKGDRVKISNIRNFTYRSVTDYTPAYYDDTFDLRTLKKLYYIVEPFSGNKGAAHTFLSFEFEKGRFLSISVEIRKEKGETFSAWRGLLKQYELMYVIADERDVIKLRSNYRKDKVFVYPIKAEPEKIRGVFLSMLARANELKEKPEFYNTIFKNCTNSIAMHVNEISPGKVPWNSSLVFPSRSDRYAFDLGLIDTTETDFEKVRESHLINTLAEKYGASSDFSLKIRGR